HSKVTISAFSLRSRRGELAHGGAGTDRAFDAVALHVAGVLAAAGGKRDFLAVELSTVDSRGAAAGLDSTGHHLELLIEGDLAVGQAPGTVDFCRDDPEQRRAPGLAVALEALRVVRLPSWNREGV